MARKHINYPESFNELYSKQNIDDVKTIIDFMNGSEHRTGRWMARCVGKSDAYISTLIGGTFSIDPSDFISQVLAVVDDSVRDHMSSEFIKTSVFQIVNHACVMARNESGFAIAAGAPGVGKTESLLQYQKLQPSTIYICGNEFTNATVVINELIDILGLRDLNKATKPTKLKAVIDALKGSQRLIILDETDKCQCDTADPLRTISDATGCGVVLAGNTQLRIDVKMGNNRYDLIESRVVFWPELITKIAPADTVLLMRPHITDDMLARGETFDELAAYCYEVTQGSARKLVKSLIKNTLMLHAQQSKNSSNYSGISRVMVKNIATKFMGIATPPPIPRRESAV